MTQEKSYKDTLNLPQTFFAMKADLAKREPDMLRGWEEEGLYARIRQKSKGRPSYILHDGPPYANGRTHIGHALNKILKDMIVKYKTLRGYDALYVPGWDCHGLPIEHACLKEMGKRKEEVERVAFRKQARQYAQRFIQIQREEFKRLGVFGQWDRPYLTMDYDYQAAIAESFLRIYEKGYIEQRLKPVPWCWDCETALADAELEYEDKTDTAVYVAFEIVSERADPGFLNLIKGQKASVLIWTTTPWTLPANVGIAYNPNLDYVVAKVGAGLKPAPTNGDGIFIFAKDLAETLKQKFGWKEMKNVAEFKGEKIPFGFVKHPFMERNSKVMDADYISSTNGTGFVHIAPGHGEEDYQYGHLEHALPILSPVDEKGRFAPSPFPSPPQGVRGDISFVDIYPEFKGMHVFKSNEKIIELLKSKVGAGHAPPLLHTEPYTHSYPHCWRCRRPIIFRATPQWFLKMDHENLRQKITDAIQNKIQFTPDGGKNRMGSMVETRPDWCLSRQRYWGVPIPVISCKACKKVLVSETKETIVKSFREHGADIWFEKNAAEFLDKGRGDRPVAPTCCQNPELIKETDIIDVWFDSGVSHQAVLKHDYGLHFPADLYLEGSDQHRGWFQSSLTAAMALEGTPPFKGILTHGFVVDGEGRKMSKSAGNVVAPQDVMKEFGADILRLWVSSCDYRVDVRLSKEILKQLADAYRKIRNTFRYLLANLYDFDPKRDHLPLGKLHGLDRWAIQQTDLQAAAIDRAYNEFAFYKIYRCIHDLCNIELSGYYFDVLKDTLYTAKKDSFLRRSAQNALFQILSRLVRLIAPILPFTADEIWHSFPMDAGIPSVHEAPLLDTQLSHDSKAQEEWERVYSLRNFITPFLERKRVTGLIGSSLEAKVILMSEDKDTLSMIQKYLKDLPRIFIVSQVECVDKMSADTVVVELPGTNMKLDVDVQKADGLKCVRCWNFSLAVGKNAEHPGLCGKCLDAVI